MEQQEVIRFFDRCAPSWDVGLVRNEAVISAILDNAGVKAGVDVLDVACGTGVLFYLSGASAMSELSFSMLVSSYFVESLPGILIQLVLLPTLVFTLMKAKLIPERYPRAAK